MSERSDRHAVGALLGATVLLDANDRRRSRSIFSKEFLK
jgi:hypothetical protein